MSSVDNRIVRMQFDNAQFERGVMQSMKTLDELNDKLQFKEAGKGISALQVHLNNVDFSGIQNAVQHINHSFTSMTGMVAQRIKEDIVDNVINAAKRLEQVTLGQIKSGGRARAENLANAKFMIEGLKYDWDAVYNAADYAVTGTAYGLDAAAKAASQLAASGVDFQETIETVNGEDLTQMHKSLRAISGVAAMTNASYDEIAHIFTSVAGMGKLTSMQLNQLSLRGLNIASTIAQETGKTEQEIRDMVTKGQISFQMFADAMDSAYGDHAKDANKTFQGSFSNLKAALSRIGAIFQQPVIDKTNTFFVSVTKRVKEFQAALSDEKKYVVTEKALARINKKVNDEAKALKRTGKEYADYVKEHTELEKKAILDNKESLTNGDVKQYTIARFATHFAEAWESAIQFVSKITESLDLSWFKSIGSFLDGAAIKATNFFNAASKAIDNVKVSIDKTSASISDALNLDINDLDLLHRVLKNEFGYVEERWAKLDEIYKKQGSTKTGKWLQGYMDQLAGVGYSFEKLGWTEEEFKKKQEEISKSEAQRVTEMTKEEVLVENLATVYTNFKKVMDGVKTSIGNTIKIISNVATSIGKVIAYANEVGRGFKFTEVLDGALKVSNALVNLSEAIQPSSESLQFFGDTVVFVGDALSSAVSFIFDTTGSFIDFVASCLKANESLDELAKNESLTSMQRAVLDVLRVINNLRRTFVALGKIIGKVFKSIKTAFQNVFGGEELGGALTAVTGGVNLLTEGIAGAAEKVAEAEVPFKAIEYIFGAVFSIIHKISNALGTFTTGIRKIKNGTEDATEAGEKALKTGEKSSSFIESLGKVAGKGFKWVSELPSKLKKLWESIKEQEGIKHLKTSLESLWKTMKESFNKGIEPMTRGMNDLAESTGGEGETLFGKVADGIGKVADKIASYIDKFPEWGKKIKEFFTSVKEWVDKTIDDLHLSELGKGLSDAFSDIFTSDDSIFVKIKKFVDTIFDTIVGELDQVDWKEVGKGGIMALVAANLFNFFRTTSGIADAMDQIKKIPNGINGIFKAVGTLFTEAKKSLSKATNAYVLANAAKVILAMAAAIVMLKDIPKDDLNKSLAAITLMSFIVYLLMKGIGYMAMGKAAKSNKIIDNSSKNLLQINSSLSGFIGVAMLVFSVGGTIWALSQAIKVISESAKYGKGSVSAAIQAVRNIVIWVGVVAAVLVILSKLNTKHLSGGDKAMAGMGVALIGIGVAIASIAGAMVLISKIGVDKAAVDATIAIVSAIILMTYVLGNAARWAQPSALLALALDMVVMSLAIGIIGAELVGLTAFMVVLDVAGKGELLLVAMGAIAGIMLAMGGALALMGIGVSKMKGPKALIGPILMMAAVIGVIGWTIKTVAEAAGSNLAGTAMAFFAIIAVLGMVVMAIDNTNKQIRRGKVSESAQVFAALAGVFAAVGACLLLMAYAVNKMSGANSWKGAIVAIAALGIISLALAKIVKSMSSAADPSVISDLLNSIAIAFVAIGASVLLIAEAANAMATVPTGALIAVGAIIGVMLIAFAALAIFVSKNDKFAEGLNKVASAFVAFGLAMVLVGAGSLLFGTSLGIISAGLGLLANGIGVLAKAFNDHKITVIVLLTVIALLAFLVHQLIKVCEPIPKVVGEVASTITETAGKAGGGLLNVLKGSASKIGSWWKTMQPKTKAMIVTGIGTLCAAILKASPQVLNTAKALLGKLIGFLVDIIPDLVQGLLKIILKLINSLAEEIRSNSAKIAYAIWNLFEAILEVVLEVLGQMILLITGTSGPFGKLGQKLVDGLSTSKGMLRKNLAEMEAYADEADEIANKYKDTALSVDAAEGDPWADKALEMQELKKEVNGATDAINDHTDAMDTYYDAAKKGAKTRIPGIPIEVENVDMTGKFIGNTLGDGAKTGFEESIGDGFSFSNGLPVDADMMFSETADEGEYAGQGLIAGLNEGIEDGQSETYTTTTTTIQDGPVAAIEDSDYDVRDAVRTHVQEPMKQELADDGFRKQLWTRAWANGQYMNEGTAEGITKTAYKVTDAMNEVAMLTNGAFVGPMKIESPSKVFFENGAFLLKGLANGILANLGLVEDASGQMGTTIMSAFGPSLDYVSKVASGELEYDPTIRPVLDASSIGRSAGSINSMFRNQNVSLSGFSGQLAADIGQLDSRNSDVVEELRALREEMSIMGEEISNMQVVMDTGALVGATAGPMDKALGQRAVRFGRGN